MRTQCSPHSPPDDSTTAKSRVRIAVCVGRCPVRTATPGKAASSKFRASAKVTGRAVWKGKGFGLRRRARIAVRGNE
jgi:hypothetical protein